jgi:hypothetical protein
MVGTGRREKVKEMARVTKQSAIRKIPATKLVQGAAGRSRPKLEAIRLKKPAHITQDEADILISMRREKERRVPLAEVLRKHGYGLEG